MSAQLFRTRSLSSSESVSRAGGKALLSKLDHFNFLGAAGMDVDCNESEGPCDRAYVFNTPRLDAEAFCAAHGDSFVRFAYLLTGDQEESRDIVQDVLASVISRWPRLSTTVADLDAYCKRAIYNKRNSWLRSRYRGRMPQKTQTPLDAFAKTEDISDHVDILRALKTLTAAQRAAIVLRYWGDMSFAEIADILDCKEATARSHVHRALNALEDDLQAHRFTDGKCSGVD